MIGTRIFQLLNNEEKLIYGFNGFNCGAMDPTVCAAYILKDNKDDVVIASERVMKPNMRHHNPCPEYPLYMVHTVHHYTCDGVLWWIMSYMDEPNMTMQQELMMICGNGPMFTRYAQTGSEESLELIQPRKYNGAPILNALRTCGTRVTTICTDLDTRIFELLRADDPVSWPILIVDEGTVGNYQLSEFEKALKRKFSGSKVLKTATIETDRKWTLLQARDANDDEDIPSGFAEQIQEDIIKATIA